MSKSDPDSAIFMEDSAKEVNRKIKGAFCKPGVIEENPCIEWARHFIFSRFGEFVVLREEKYGGNK